MFRVGQKVVCVANFLGPLKYSDEILPEKGEVYTVGEIVVCPEGTGLRLVEIVNPVHEYIGGPTECCFSASAFRPAVERETDISIFKALLNPQTISKETVQ